MAITVTNSCANSTITGGVSGLTYPANTYDSLNFRVWYRTIGSSTWAGYNDYDLTELYGSVYSFTYQFTAAQGNGYEYEIAFYANYSGTWYGPFWPSGLCTAVPYATFSGESTEKTNIIFTYSNTVGNMTLYTWNDSSWVTIASSGLPYSKSGDQITISTLIPNTSYNFIVRTTVGSDYSDSPQGTYKTYTTQAWPTVPSGVVLGSSGRAEGALYLTWGDHSYEGSGFQYYLKFDGGAITRFSGNENNYYYCGAGGSEYGAYGTQHYFQATAAYNGYTRAGVQTWYLDNSGWTTAAYIYTAPKTPTGITVGTVTSSSIYVTASISGSYPGYNSVEWRWRVNGGGGSYSNYQDYGGSLSYNISGLSACTTYEIGVHSYHSASGLYSVGYYTITQATSTRPSNWSWSVTITANGSSGIVVDNANKRIKILTATEINNFRDRIDAFRAYKSLSASGISSVSQYQAATASYANSLRTAILAMSPPVTLPSAVSAGGKITAAFLNGLVSSLNSIT